MAQRATADDDEPLELTPDMEADEGPDDESEEGGEGEEEGDKPDDEGEEEAEPIGDEADEASPPAFEDEEPDDADNSVIRGLRERNKQLARENAQMRTAQSTPPPPAELPPEPTLADCDYDEDVFKAAIKAWEKTSREIEDGQAEYRRQAEQANREWQRDIENMNSRKAALALPDYDDSANTVAAVLTLPQQAVIVKAASDSAAFIYALGRSDSRLAELAKIEDPIKLAAAVARMEGGIKLVKKRRAPAPDRAASGSGRMPGGADKQLEKLEVEADRTGDRTALLAYKKKLKERAKK